MPSGNVTADDYKPTATEMLVWYMFLDLDHKTILRMLSKLAELPEVTGEDILKAWETYHELLALRGLPDGLR